MDKWAYELGISRSMLIKLAIVKLLQDIKKAEDLESLLKNDNELRTCFEAIVD